MAPPQSTPAGRQLPAPGALGTLQVPSTAPVALVQTPPQHSVFVEHTSPVWVQNDGWAEQIPALQNLEQQSELPAQGLPAVLHVPLSGLQKPVVASQVPLQQSDEATHPWLSGMQSLLSQTPPTQVNVQHSLPAAHAAPGALHVPTGDTHFFEIGRAHV